MTAKQAPPKPAADYTGFPEHVLPAGAEMYRAHAQGPWYFSNGGAGRFDLQSPRGTCYTSVDVRTAVREKLRDAIADGMVVEHGEAARFSVSVLTAPDDYRCAAVGHNDAEKFGVVRELTTMHDYDIPQQWAATFDDTGFDGIFYGSAYTTGAPNAYALFGEEGEHSPADGFLVSETISGVEACESIGMTVEAIPSIRSIDLI